MRTLNKVTIAIRCRGIEGSSDRGREKWRRSKNPSRSRPDLFFSQPAQGGLESFGLGGSEGTLPTGPILFPVASSDSAQGDPFAAIGTAPPANVSPRLAHATQSTSSEQPAAAAPLATVSLSSVASPSPSASTASAPAGQPGALAVGELETISLDQPACPPATSADQSTTLSAHAYGGAQPLAPSGTQSWPGQTFPGAASAPAPARTLPVSSAVETHSAAGTLRFSALGTGLFNTGKSRRPTVCPSPAVCRAIHWHRIITEQCVCADNQCLRPSSLDR